MNVVMTLEEWYDRKIKESKANAENFSLRTDYSRAQYWRGVQQGFIEAKEILTKVVV